MNLLAPRSWNRHPQRRLAPTAEPLPELSTRQRLLRNQLANPGYPPPPTSPPPTDPYPGGLVWIIRPVGVQCEDGTAEGYGDLSESVATLTAAGLQVEAVGND